MAQSNIGGWRGQFVVRTFPAKASVEAAFRMLVTARMEITINMIIAMINTTPR